MWEALWTHGQCACLQIKWSGFEPWPGTLCKCINGNQQILYCWIKKLPPDGPLDSYAEFFYLRGDPQGFHLQT